MTNLIVKKISFQSEQLTLIGYLYSPAKIKNPPGVLFLHGASKTMNRNIFKSWQKYLAERGISSLSFFSRGVGESEGEFENSSLINREKDSICALKAYQDSGLIDKSRIAIIANSMGGHVAAKIAGHPDIKAVVLYAAAAYAKVAENKNLDQSFTAAISKPNSWQDSPAFTSLSAAKKPLLIIYPEKDEVIPQGVKDAYRTLASKNYIEIPNATHQSISERTELDKKLMVRTYESSVNFLIKLFP